MKKKNKSQIPSPCISICAMDEETGYCRGCFRTREEITQWERYESARKLDITNELPLRSSKITGPSFS